ncbi:DUF3081 family protein [Saccharospirillum sp.]|uniref:DUF3081 family protein n=1 Tax=Saccharospirillum sp. TaxID=2033801 RepID=UPI0034A07C8E
MSEKIEAGNALRAFQTVIDNGTKTDEGYELDGLVANTGVDGYTVTLSDGAVTLTLMFHQSFSVDSPNARATENFIKRLDALLDKYQ